MGVNKTTKIHDPLRVGQPIPGLILICGFLKKVDSVNVTLLLILLYVDFLAFSPVRG